MHGHMKMAFPSLGREEERHREGEPPGHVAPVLSLLVCSTCCKILMPPPKSLGVTGLIMPHSVEVVLRDPVNRTQNKNQKRERERKEESTNKVPIKKISVQ